MLYHRLLLQGVTQYVKLLCNGAARLPYLVAVVAVLLGSDPTCTQQPKSNAERARLTQA